MRRRYYLFISVAYILVGAIILIRSAMAHVLIIAILGIIFVALGLVRLRDYASWRRAR